MACGLVACNSLQSSYSLCASCCSVPSKPSSHSKGLSVNFVRPRPPSPVTRRPSPVACRLSTLFETPSHPPTKRERRGSAASPPPYFLFLRQTLPYLNLNPTRPDLTCLTRRYYAAPSKAPPSNPEQARATTVPPQYQVESATVTRVFYSILGNRLRNPHLLHICRKNKPCLRSPIPPPI